MIDPELRDLVGNEPKPSPVIVRDFKAWHRPRKQYIRSQQWSIILRDLLQELSQNGHSKIVKYFCLPAEEYLDVRVIHDTVKDLGADWRLRFLGFDQSASSAAVLDAAIVHDLPQLLSEGSRCVPYPLESIARLHGPASGCLREFGGFDAVNIDLCGSIHPQRNGGVLAAVKALLEHQLVTRAEPWLLFVTTRVDVPALDETAREKLMNCVQANSRKHEDFRQLLEIEFPSFRAIDEALPGVEVRVGAGLVSLGLAKWLLSLLRVRTDRLSVEKSFMYSVSGADPDMVALSFRFARQAEPLVDESGLTPPAKRQTPAISEGKLACRLIKPLSKMRDVDRLLVDEPELKERCVKESAALLERAGHDRAAYLTWVESQPS
jgi:hypothetical protein